MSIIHKPERLQYIGARILKIITLVSWCVSTVPSDVNSFARTTSSLKIPWVGAGSYIKRVSKKYQINFTSTYFTITVSG